MPSHGSSRIDDEDKPCRACSDFKSWTKLQGKKSSKTSETEPPRKDCPLDKDELGTSTWGFLHTMASYFPKTPTNVQSDAICKFFHIFAEFYPCEPCAEDFKIDLQENPPKTSSRDELAKWLCERHNTVNVKLGKPMFDCSKVHERWRDGWEDGSCD